MTSPIESIESLAISRPFINYSINPDLKSHIFNVLSHPEDIHMF